MLNDTSVSMRTLSPRTQGLIAINIAAVIFGSAALYGKLDVSPFWITSMRAAFGAVTLLALGLWKGDIGFPPRELWKIFIVTGVILAVHWLSFFASVQWAGVAVATLTFATFPLFTVLIEARHHRRKPHLAEIGAAFVIILAVGLLVNPHNGRDSLWGAAAGLVSAIAYACFWHTSKDLSRSLSPLRVSLYQNAVTALVLAPFLALMPPMPSAVADWLWLALLGIVNTALMLQLYLYALKHISPSTCSGFVALEPVYAILLAALFFHEPVTLWVALSAALIIGASFVFLKAEKA
jgi:drug/metabolite transporter (DMT)-like permease